MQAFCRPKFVIFFSYCSPQNQYEFKLREVVVETLLKHGCKVIDSADLTTERCIIDEIFQITSAVDAVVSLAFPRNSFLSSGATNQRGTSPWIHVEATLAYILKTPLLLMGDHTLYQHGVFDQRSMPCTRLFFEFSELEVAKYADVAQGVEQFLNKHLTHKGAKMAID